MNELLHRDFRYDDSDRHFFLVYTENGDAFFLILLFDLRV